MNDFGPDDSHPVDPSRDPLRGPAGADPNRAGPESSQPAAQDDGGVRPIGGQQPNPSEPYRDQGYWSQPYGQDHAGQDRYPGQDHHTGQGSYGAGGYGTDPYASSGSPATGYYGYPATGPGQPASAPQAAPVGPPVRTKRRRGGGVLVLAVLLAALIGAGAGIGSFALASRQNGAGSAPIAVSTTQATQAPVLNGTIEAAASKIEPSVVTITVQDGSSGDIGSGVVLDRQGHILTNNHVVAAQTAAGYGQSTPNTSDRKISVTFNNGKTVPATVIGTAATEDLAVVKVDDTADLVPATFATSSSIRVGQSVVAAGAPLGLSETITSGIVSSTARPVRSGNNNDAVYLAVQTDAPINPGNSGGPLVDLNAQVVGINSSIASTGSSSSDGSQSGNIGIGFAIPSDVATRVAQQLINTGKSADAALGVTISSSSGESFGATTSGVPLATVRTGGGAAAAGLRAGDVVTRVNDFRTTSADGLIAATRFYAPGTKVNLTYTRNGSATTVPVTLGSS